MSKASLEAMGIINPHAKLAFTQMHFNQINNEGHYNNIVAYIKRKKVLIENENIKWRQDGRLSLLAKVREIKNKPKHSAKEMAEFRRDYPAFNSWKTDCIKLRLSKVYSNHFQSQEDQRMKEDETCPCWIVI